ncbi:hypothetical protein B0H16DRAFT_1722484 [Mycena metata]|uniref:Uncharacterized protein n=1 Tax=Mycena metata TaxID=1033252 RepID=A0AAD7J319_9AGAR|nr:hypothetical protein B0H16DRAFT_1722484 [Mycena metata]
MPPTRSARVSQHRQPRLCADVALIAAAASCPAAHRGRIVRVAAPAVSASSDPDVLVVFASSDPDEHDDVAANCVVPAASAAFDPAALRRSRRIADLSRPARAYSLEVDLAHPLREAAVLQCAQSLLTAALQCGQYFTDQ